MDIFIRDSYEAMSRYAATVIADIIRFKPDSVIGLATGGTPIGTYRELIRMHREEGLDFSQIRTFNLDEYLGAGMDLSQQYSADQSFARFMYEELFKHINIKMANTRIPDGLTKDPRACCCWYEDEITKAGGIDIQLLGIGGNGHLGFNEPGSSLASRTSLQTLSKQTLDDNYEVFYKKAGLDRDHMPHFAITMGIGTILDARKLLMIADGIRKADIVAKCIEGPLTSQVPASAIQLHGGETIVVLDSEAASKLNHLEHYRFVERMKQAYGL